MRETTPGRQVNGEFLHSTPTAQEQSPCKTENRAPRPRGVRAFYAIDLAAAKCA
jgi:hypothetical protein